MKLELSYGIETGTDRGGEDVWLQVVFTTDQEPVGDLENQGRKAFDAWLESAPKNIDELVEDEAWVKDGRVRTYTSEYDYTVDESVETVRRDVGELAQEGLFPQANFHWTYNLATREYKLVAQLYRDGNAD